MKKMLRTFFLCSLFVLGFVPSKGWSKTVTLQAEDIDMLAYIGVESPKQSWMAWNDVGATWSTYNGCQQATAGRGCLIRYSLDKIPKGQRITHADLTLKISGIQPLSARLYCWRLLAKWGAGVSHQFRMLRPEKLEWAVPGAHGNSIDRATKPSGTLNLTQGNQNSSQIINVTEDVELWYSGSAQNYGWLINVEDEGCTVYLHIPLVHTNGELEVTYEPQ